MKRPLRVVGYIFLGMAVLVMAANQFIRVTGGPHGKDQGIIAFFLSEKLFVKEKTATGRDKQSVGRQSHFKWKESREGTSRHMAFSYEAVRKAEAIFAEKTPDTFSSSDLINVITALEQALANAELVSDVDLDSIHPQMRAEFRQKYQTALKKVANGFKQRDQTSAIEGFELYQNYRAWAFSHQKEFSSPSE
jgi:hypothetical protein